MSDIKPQIREAHRAPSRINAPNTTPRSVLFSLWKTKVKAKMLNKKKKKARNYASSKRVTWTVPKAEREGNTNANREFLNLGNYSS